MEIRLIEALHCPYCGGGFRIARDCQPETGRLRYGLLECRCFTFPVVDGILLLNLSKGGGDAQDEVQPYVPLQIAALRYLARDDVAGLRAWIRRHLPLAAELIDGTSASYLNVAARYDHVVEREAARYLAKMGRYRVVGLGRRSRWKHRLARLWPAGSGLSSADEQARLASYYVSRFFSPRVNALALYLGHLPVRGRVLSLCCGHGMFENLLRADGRAEQVVSVDGLFLNLLMARHYAGPDGVFICHDVQFPLPFADGFFDGVFSSSCLPEIPSQRSFVREAIRVTADTGWTVFDSVWNEEVGVHRVNTQRHYRFCQNFFASLDDYLPLVRDGAGSREVGLDIAGLPEKYLQAPTWAFAGEHAALMAGRDDPLINLLVIDRDRFAGFTPPVRDWLSAGALSVSPAYRVQAEGSTLQLQRREEFAAPRVDFVPARFAGYAAQASLDTADLAAEPAAVVEAYCAGRLALLPERFAPGLALAAAPRCG